MKRSILFLFLLHSAVSFSQEFSFEKLFAENPTLQEIAANPKHKVQIIFSEIDRSSEIPELSSHYFQVDSSSYYYPASTVKMPTAFLALQRLNELGIDKETPLKIGADRFPQTAVHSDTTSANRLPSIAHYIKKIFVQSDNDAYNRLFEFLGQNYINQQLTKKGLHSSKIVHRLVGGYDGMENQYTNPMWFYDAESTEIIYEQPGRISKANVERFSSLKDQFQGKGYIANDSTIYEAFDFSRKNFISLQDLHDQLQSVVLPETVPEKQRFNFSEEDYKFLREWMCKLPDESGINAYTTESDNSVKSILFGDEDKAFQIPEHIKIYNKIGFAYGYLTDVAYIVDEKNNIEFLLAAQMLVNENEIFNDGEYEYSDVGAPFLGQLGKAIYNFVESGSYQPVSFD